MNPNNQFNQGYQYPQQQPQFQQGQFSQQIPQGINPQFQQQFPQQFVQQGMNPYQQPQQQQQFPQYQQPYVPQQQQYPIQQQQFQPIQQQQYSQDVGSNIAEYNKNYHNNILFFVYNSNKIFSYNFQTKQFIPMMNSQNFVFPQFYRTTLLPDGSYLITGGCDTKENDYSTVTLYSPQSGQFYLKKNLNVPRRAHCAIYNNGYVYVFGGVSNKKGTATCERYNLQTDTWEMITSLSKPRELLSCCNFNNDRILIVNGIDSNSGKDTDLIECYNILNGQMSVLNFRAPEKVYCPFVVQHDKDNIIIFGGFSQKSDDSDTVSLLNVNTGAIVKKGSFETTGQPGGWGIHQPVYQNGMYYLFITGEGNETDTDIGFYKA